MVRLPVKQFACALYVTLVILDTHAFIERPTEYSPLQNSVAPTSEGFAIIVGPVTAKLCRMATSYRTRVYKECAMLALAAIRDYVSS